MGGFSSLFEKGGLRKYFGKKVDLEQGDGIIDELEDEESDNEDKLLTKRSIKWWEWFVFDKRTRIVYVVILGVLLGLVIPMLIFNTERESTFGSCLINNNARFQCLINSVEAITEKMCDEAKCCWEASDGLPFKCYHSLPSAYQYTVSENISDSDRTTLKLEPTLNSMGQFSISRLESSIFWQSSTHLVMNIFNPDVIPENERQSQRRNSGRNKKLNEVDDATIHVNGGNTDRFYIEIVRNGTGETIFDTRLGPVIATNESITFSTILPSPYFYGLKGGQGSLSTLTYTTVNGFENMELPFYISSEKSGMWHGVLIDTEEPILVQVVQAAGIMFHIETDRPEVSLHLFTGPRQEDILDQLYFYIRTKHGIQQTHPPIPPYWGLGLHLCRRVENSTVVLNDIKMLMDHKESGSFLYDSDCIDDYLRHPVDIDESRFGISEKQDLEEILELLGENSKKIFLTQKVTKRMGQDNALIPNAWLLDPKSEYSSSTSFSGEVNNMTVNFMDFFNPAFEEFPTPPDDFNIEFHGISLEDNFPTLYNASSKCKPSTTRIQSWFSSPRSSSNSSALNETLLWSAVCPEALHKIGVAEETENGTDPKLLRRHMHLHNTYGERSLKAVQQALLSKYKSELLLTSSSIWTSSLYYGAFNGLQVPFTWQGLRESVFHTVRNFALAPISSTPICGSPIFNLPLTFNEDLCLRWFQFGLLLPLSKNLYDGISSHGPLNFSVLYNSYLQEAVTTRYTYAPYYFTTLQTYQAKEKFLPFIRPMTFDFHDDSTRSNTLPLVDQFMIGEAILAAPILAEGVTRTVYFPPGTWYTKEGLEVWNDSTTGSLNQITGYILETPMFIRGGYIVPTLEFWDTTNSKSIDETLINGKYSLLVAPSYLSKEGDSAHSHGNLYVKDDGRNGFHHVKFYASFITNDDTFVLQVNDSLCEISDSKFDDNLSTVIDQVRILASTNPKLRFTDELNVILKSNDGADASDKPYQYYGDHNALRIYDLGMDWCAGSGYTITISKK